MGVVGGLADAIEKVDREVVLVLGELDLAREGVEVTDKGGHHRAQPRVRRPRHGGEDDIGNIVHALDDAVGRQLLGRGWHGHIHGGSPQQSIGFTPSI